MTNGDRIRQMSNEELAELLNGNCTYCTWQEAGSMTMCIGGCGNGIKAYLDMEVEEWKTSKLKNY